MNKEILKIDKFNIVSDEENYYFFRALNMADNNDIEKRITTSSNGKIERIRTDRERYDGTAKYKEDSTISLEEIYDHIKMHYRRDTNCISLTSNANIAINYGRGSYTDKYVMIKVPKKEFGEETVEAGQYMLQELYSKIEKSIDELPKDLKYEILEVFSNIDNANEKKELQEIITKRYTAPNEEVNPKNAHPRKGIKYSAPKSRISSYQSLNEAQLLEVNKIYAKLAVLENENILEHVIPHSSNSKLRETIGNAFSSTEVIHYGEINKNEIIEVPKEIVDLFSLIQQINGIDKNKVEEIKKELLIAVQNGKEIPKIPEIENNLKDDISIEEMYSLTDGKVEYSKVNSIVKNMFYLSKARKNAIELSNVLKEILENDSRFQDTIQYIRENGFRVEPEIISRRSGKGVKISESVNLDLTENEQILADEIKKLSSDEIENVLQNGGLTNVQNIVSKVYGDTKRNAKIDKSKYYAEAIIAQYNWQEIGIEEFKISEKNELIKRLQDRNCIDIYEKLKNAGIEEKQIPTILLNIATRQGFYEEYQKGNLEQLINTRQNILQNNINIEIVEKFLGYYDVENTGIRLKNYQQKAFNNTNKILENHKFAQIILPTGAGKSFVALAQMQKYVQEHKNEQMLYLAPQDEILNQIKSYIVKHVHGKQETVGKTEDEIIAEVFPNITFETYPGLLAKRGKETINEQYGMIVLDELHRTGAKMWEGKIDKLLKNQSEKVKILGITATPTRDVDGRDMAEETARKLGYTEEEIKKRKHLASDMTLENAIRMGYVVNPKVVYCKYDLISSSKMNDLREKIDDIEDETKRKEELKKYNELKNKLNNEIDAEIGEKARKKLEEDSRKNIDNGIGKEEILRQNVKKGGKYIIFIPVTNQGDIEDEEENTIDAKTGYERIQTYQEYLNNAFKETDIVPQMHSLLGSYSKEKNKKELEMFESDNSEETKFMVVMNKANEGLHIDGVDGIIWFRALDENSKILYMQQLGRAIYALDEDNPLPDDKRPVVIDLANNTLSVKMEKEFEKAEPLDDLEALTIVVEWINEHDEMIPSRESTNKQEQHYYNILRRIQNKYSKYLEGFDKFNDLEDEQKNEITEIINLASEIDLWNMDLPPILKSNGGKEEFDLFTVEGLLKDFVELEDMVDSNITRSTYLRNALKIEAWCKKYNEGKLIWERNLPSKGAEDEEERVLAIKLGTIRANIIKKYDGKELSSIEDEEDRKIVEIIANLDREYGLKILLKNALEIKDWCERKNEGKPKWERNLPKQGAEDEEERALAIKLNNIRTNIIKKYDGKELSSIEDEEDRKIVEIIAKLDREYGLKTSLKNALEIKDWCERKNEGKPRWERNLPNRNAEDEEERKLANKLNKIRIKIIKKYEGKELSSIEDEEDRKIVEIIRGLDREYGLKTPLKDAFKIKDWCERKNEGKPRWERNLPSNGKEKDEEERVLATKLSNIRTTIKKYEGKELSSIEDEEDRKIVEIIANLDRKYGLKTPLKDAYKIKDWCERNNEGKPRWKRNLPNRNAEDEEERALAKKLKIIRTTIKKYEGKELSSIEDEEDRKIVEIIAKLDREYGLKAPLKNALEIKDWCERNNEGKPRWERNLPNRNAEDEEERALARKLDQIRTKIIKKYEGKELSSIEDEEDRKIVEIIRMLDNEYNSKKAKLEDAKGKRDKAKEQKKQAETLSEQVSEQLLKEGVSNEKQQINNL